MKYKHIERSVVVRTGYQNTVGIKSTSKACEGEAYQAKWWERIDWELFRYLLYAAPPILFIVLFTIVPYLQDR